MTAISLIFDASGRLAGRQDTVTSQDLVLGFGQTTGVWGKIWGSRGLPHMLRAPACHANASADCLSRGDR